MDEKLQKSKDFFLSDSYKSQFAKIDLDSFPSVFQRRKEEGAHAEWLRNCFIAKE